MVIAAGESDQLLTGAIIALNKVSGTLINNHVTSTATGLGLFRKWFSD